MPSNLSQTIWYWMKNLGIPVSKTLLRQRLEQHPDYPSVLSITDTLQDFGIDSMALEIDRENVQQLPIPFLAHMHGSGGGFELINTPEIITDYSNDFFKSWSGIIVAAEKPEIFADKENQETLKQETKRQYLWISLLLLLITISCLSILQVYSLIHSLILLTSLLGVGTASLIVMQELGVNNELTKALCSTGKNTDCNTVIQSDGAKILKWLSWSDIGIIFFSSQWLILIASDWSNAITGVPALMKLLSFASLSFVCFSVYYQWKIAKKWCRLCLIVVGLLLLQAVALLLLQVKSLTGFSVPSIVLFLFTFSGITAIWLLIKPLLKKQIEMQKDLYALLRFKKSPDIFISLLQQQRQVNITAFTNELEIASAGATLQILVACNPYCAPCAKAHEVLQGLAENYGDRISIAIRFAIEAANKKDERTKAVEYILRTAICKGGDSMFNRKILHAWFEEMNFEKFARQYPLTCFMNVDEHLRMHEEWAENIGIEFTPSIFINGFQLPKQYSFYELPGLIKQILNKEEVMVTNNTPLLEAV